jgi:hypothetical protein
MWVVKIAEVQVQKTINCATEHPKVAYNYAKKKFRDYNINIDAIIPNFAHNYMLIQSYCRKYAKDIPRYKMPVIEPKDMEKFENDLKSGRIDVVAPWAKKELKFPSSFKDSAQRERWLNKGLRDGEVFDDYVPVNIVQIPCGALKPTQSQIWFNLLIKYIIKYGLPTQTSSVVNTTIIVSSDKYILDGHHRWAEAVLVNPDLSMKCLLLPFNVDYLIKVGRSYGEAIGNQPNH